MLGEDKAKTNCYDRAVSWWAPPDLNREPDDYEPPALTN